LIPRQPIDHRLQLCSLFDAAVAAAQPALCLPPHLPTRPKGRTIVIGAGKASAAMARALEDHWDGPLEGLVVTRYGYAVPCERIRDRRRPRTRCPMRPVREAAAAHPGTRAAASAPMIW
jgi:glycerate-2-kinase